MGKMTMISTLIMCKASNDLIFTVFPIDHRLIIIEVIFAKSHKFPGLAVNFCLHAFLHYKPHHFHGLKYITQRTYVPDLYMQIIN